MCKVRITRRCSGRGCHEGILRGPDDVMRRGFCSKGIRPNETQTHSFLFGSAYDLEHLFYKWDIVSPFLGGRPAFLEK